MANEQELSVPLREEQPQVEEAFVVVKMTDGHAFSIRMSENVQLAMTASGSYRVSLQSSDRQRAKIAQHAFRIVQKALGG